MDSNHNQNMNSGLTRYRSAPSSYFSNLINTDMYEDEQDIHPLFTPQTEHILSNLDQIRANESHFMDSMKQEQVTFSSQSQSQQQQQQQQMMYQNPDQYQKVVVNNNSVETNLLRQSSSPAGVFQQNNMDNGYSMIRSMENFRHVNGSVTDSSAEKRLKNRMASHSSTRLLSRIPENEGKVMAHNNGGYLSSFKGGCWGESGMLNDEFMKEYGEHDRIISSENQNDEGRVHVSTGLTHQLSLSTSSNELFVMKNLMQFQDSVPLRSRAKRGCATHPRSIAERVRRTRISERIRRLQDVVPNMDKQTNTADMLDLAVDYIKKLQKQVEALCSEKQTLSDHHSKCRCPHKQKLI